MLMSGVGLRWAIGLLLALLLMPESSSHAARWSRRYIRQLPDAAFAAIEITPAGRNLRHLPHHDARGEIDIPHLCSALSRLNQVKWHDPTNAEAAKRHLHQHLDAVGRSSCQPPRKTGR